MAVLSPPFTGTDMQSLYNKIIKGVYPNIPALYSQDLSTTIRSMLQVNPSSRPTCARILDMPIIQRYSARLGNNDNEIQNNLLGTIRYEGFSALKNKLPVSNYEKNDRIASARPAKREELNSQRAIMSAKGGRPPILGSKANENRPPIIEEYTPKSNEIKNNSVRPLLNQARAKPVVNQSRPTSNEAARNHLVNNKPKEPRQILEIQKLQELLNNPKRLDNIYSEKGLKSDRDTVNLTVKQYSSPKIVSKPITTDKKYEIPYKNEYKSPLNDDIRKIDPKKFENPVKNDYKYPDSYKASNLEDILNKDYKAGDIYKILDNKRYDNLNYRPPNEILKREDNRPETGSLREERSNLESQYRQELRNQGYNSSSVREEKRDIVANSKYSKGNLAYNHNTDEKNELLASSSNKDSRDQKRLLELYQNLRTNIRDEKKDPVENSKYRPSSREENKNVVEKNNCRPVSREHNKEVEASRPSSRDKASVDQYTPSSYKKPSMEPYRPNSREKTSILDQINYRPSSREASKPYLDQYRPSPREQKNVILDNYKPSHERRPVDQYRPPSQERTPMDQYRAPTQDKKPLEQNRPPSQDKRPLDQYRPSSREDKKPIELLSNYRHQEKEYIPELYQKYNTPSQDRKVNLDMQSLKLQEDKLNRDNFQLQYKSPYSQERKQPGSRDIKRDDPFEKNNPVDLYQNYKSPIHKENSQLSRQSSRDDKKYGPDPSQNTRNLDLNRLPSREEPRNHVLQRKPSYPSSNPVVPQLANRDLAARKAGAIIASPKARIDPIPSYNNQLKVQYDRLQSAQQKNSQNKIENRSVW